MSGAVSSQNIQNVLCRSVDYYTVLPKFYPELFIVFESTVIWHGTWNDLKKQLSFAGFSF